MDSLNRLTTDFASWEELNDYVGMKRSEPFKEYFDPMQISAEQKKRRIFFAESLEEEIIYLMAFFFYRMMDDAVAITSFTDIVSEIRSGYIKAYGTPDEYIESRSEQLGNEIIDTTMRHQDDPYYVSKDRARRIAEEEANTALNHKEYMAALQGFTHKQWVTILDGHERETHGEIAGTTIPIGDLFYVGDSIMAYPRDLTYSPSPGEVINCRCSLKFIKR